MLDPKIIMLDEPTAGLSPIIVDEVLENIISLKKNIHKEIERDIWIQI